MHKCPWVLISRTHQKLPVDVTRHSRSSERHIFTHNIPALTTLKWTRKQLSEKHIVITVYSCLNNLISPSMSLYIHVSLEIVKVMKCKSSLMDLIRVHASWIMKHWCFQYILYRLTSKKPTEAVRRSPDSSGSLPLCDQTVRQCQMCCDLCHCSFSHIKHS